MDRREWMKLATSIVICELAGVAGSIFTVSSIPTWYAGLSKPWFSPPNWVFAPVWVALYAMMGAAAYIAIREEAKGRHVRLALGVFVIQLALNVLWSGVFFGLRSPIAGLAVIIALWLMIAYTIRLFLRISRPSGLLLVPYIAWVSFAALLNYYVYALN